MVETTKQIWNNWQGNYSFNGGLSAVWNCLLGTLRLRRGKFSQMGPTSPQVDIVTFSVVPQLTALWASFIDSFIDTGLIRFLIGDCSGSLQRHIYSDSSAIIVPLLNYDHGNKTDMFLHNVCQAEYIVVTDDDIFWLDEKPLKWALGQMKSDTRIASISLLPKRIPRDLIDNKEHLFMGSSFVIRRQIWLDENLSFKRNYSPFRKGYSWFYEIGEFAQDELMKHNYKIIFAPDAIRESLLAFEAVSSWTIRIRIAAGDLTRTLRLDPQPRSRKALAAIYAMNGLMGLVSKYYPSIKKARFLPEEFLQKAEAACLKNLSKEQINDIGVMIEAKLTKLNAALEARWPAASQRNR